MNVDRNNSGGFSWGLLQWTLGSIPISQKIKNPTITIYNLFTELKLNNIC